MFFTCTKKKLYYKISFLLFSFFWITALRNSNTTFSAYEFVFILSFAGFIFNALNKYFLKTKWDRIWSNVFAALLSLCTVFAEHDLFAEMGSFFNRILVLVIFIAGILIWREILLFSHYLINNKVIKGGEIKKSSAKIFLISFAGISLLNIFVLIFVHFPGVLFYDSIRQLEQIESGIFSNHHPYYYTKLIEIFVKTGQGIFGSLEAGIFTYSVFSVLIMAAIISFSIMTLHQLRINKYIITAVGIFYAVMPYNIMFSFTMTKDTFFAGASLSLLTGIYRAVKNIGNKWINYTVIALSAIFVGIVRSNGWLALFISTAVFLIFFWRENKKRAIGYLCVIILIISYILKGPVINSLGIPQPDTIEALSIPTQQIARVVVEDKPIDDNQKKLIDNIVDIKKVKKIYLPYISDPIKESIRKKDYQSVLKKNFKYYFLLYIQLGLAYPKEYVKAWIDMTKGYYNGGYDYWIWSDHIHENDFGLVRQVNSEFISNLFGRYLAVYTEIPLFNIFISIGLHTWILCLFIYIGIVKRDRIFLFMGIFILTNIFTLLVATPVFAEFRYAYSTFLALPFLFAIIFDITRKVQD